VRVAINLEQVLQEAPGGIGRYSAALVRLLPEVTPGDAVVPFVAAHRRADVARAWDAWDIPAATKAVVLPLPRPVLYDAWHLLNAPDPAWFSRRLRRVDIVHAPSVAVPPTGSKPLVVTVHDAAPLIAPQAFTARGRRFHAQGIRAASRRATLIIAPSHAAADEIARHTDIAADRLRVVHNGVDLAVASDAEVARVRERFGLDDVPFVLWAGVLQPRKNVGVLVDAFARLLDRHELSHRLVLAGPNGWLSAPEAPSIAALGDRVQTLGAVAPDDLRALMRAADVFAFPSRYEGFGLPVLEAMAQSTPVVSADIPVLREVAGDEATFVDPDDVDGWTDALAATIGDLRERAAQGSGGRARAEQFSWQRCVLATRAVYAEAIAQ
jgi:glycosyltransferase involved in cell wall biosynthesis